MSHKIEPLTFDEQREALALLNDRGTIKEESVYTWKATLVAITRAFDVEAIDKLLFLAALKKDFLVVTGDGVLHFARLIAAGFASVNLKATNNWLIVTCAISITVKGGQPIDAWKEGDRVRVKQVMGGPVPAGVISKPKRAKRKNQLAYAFA